MKTLVAVLLIAPWLAHGRTAVRAAAFRADATPPPGAPLIWVTPAERVADPLWAKGVVIEIGGRRHVLAALDWCGVGGSSHRLLREKMAEGASTKIHNVTLHVVHQHTAPYLVGDAHELLKGAANPPLAYPREALEDLARRLGAAAKASLRELKPVDSIGLGEAAVDCVASARRLFLNGKHVTRYSSSGKSPELMEAPEGDVDRNVKTITLASAGKPVVRIHYYASHPQTFCCEGTVSADFVGAAREAVEKEDGVPQVYFTGGGGDVTVGKYNDGTPEKRQGLAERMRAGLLASIRSTRYEALQDARWRTVPVTLPRRAESDPVMAAHRAKFAAADRTPPADLLRSAIAVAFSKRKTPLEISALSLGRAVIVHLPGEPLLEFQRFAQQVLPGRFVTVAGYGDIMPGYICPDRSYDEGGYEPSASNVAPGSEAVLKSAIKAVMSEKAK
jgi:hypothetical protein